MKTIKKCIVYFLLLVFAVQSAGIGSLTCEAADGYFVSGNFCCHKIAKNKVEIYGLTKKCKTLVIPERISYKGKKYTVTQIADMDKSWESTNHVSDYWYQIPKKYLKKNGKANLIWASGITKVVLPKTLTYIGEGAFCDASKLKKVVFAKKYKKLVIGRHAFGGNALKSLEFPEGTCELGDYAAGDVPNLTIPASVKRIGAGVVNNHTRNVKLSRKNKRFKMDSGILYTCDGQTLLGASAGVKGKVTLPPETIKLTKYAFFDSKITEINISGNIRELPTEIFYGCGMLERVTGMEQVEKIGASAFRDCGKLTDIGSLPNVTEIKDYAFVGAGSLSVKIGARMYVADHAFAPSGYAKKKAAVSVEEGDPVYSIENGLLLKQEGTGKTVLLQTCDMECVEVPEGVAKVPVSLGTDADMPGASKTWEGVACRKVILPESLEVQEGKIYTYGGSIIYQAKKVPDFKEGFSIYNVSREKKETTVVYVPAKVLKKYKTKMEAAAGLLEDPEDWDGLFVEGLKLKPYNQSADFGSLTCEAADGYFVSGNLGGNLRAWRLCGGRRAESDDSRKRKLRYAL